MISTVGIGYTFSMVYGIRQCWSESTKSNFALSATLRRFIYVFHSIVFKKRRCMYYVVTDVQKYARKPLLIPVETTTTFIRITCILCIHFFTV